MVGIHTGAVVDYGGGRYARAVTYVAIGGGVHTGPLVDLGGGRYARAVRTVSGAGGTYSGSLVQTGATVQPAVLSVAIGAGVHTGALVDLGGGRYSLAVVDVPTPGPGQSSRAVTPFDVNGAPV